MGMETQSKPGCSAQPNPSRQMSQPPSIDPHGRAREAGVEAGVHPFVADHVRAYTELYDAAMKRVIDAQDDGKRAAHCGYEYVLSELVQQLHVLGFSAPIAFASGQKARAIASFRAGTPGVPADLLPGIEEDEAGLVEWLETHMDEMVHGTYGIRLYVVYVHEDGTVFARFQDESAIDLISVLANPRGLTPYEAWALIGTAGCTAHAIPAELEISVDTTPYVEMA